LWSGAANFMTTEALRASAGAFRGSFTSLWERVLRLSRRTPRRLRLCESLPLGERRFVAVVEFDRARFLVGGTPTSLVLLSRLADAGGRAGDETEPEDVSGNTVNEATAAANPRRSETC
jgi:flagellar biogenesis protein FliO